MNKTLEFLWHVPFGDFSLRLDPLSVLFLTAIFILVLCAGIYGVGYMRSYQGGKSLGLHIFFYILLALALIVVVTANNVILFLGAWEVLAISVYFLIVFQDEKPSVRRAAFLYLIAAHCGTFCLFLMFFLMAHAAGSMNFDVMAQTNFSPVIAGTIFFLALLGFGVKAGIFPMHIWLPYAHPAAPSHVSALLSGVAIKTGIYGICRILWIIGVLPDWCGYVLLILGIVSGVMGVLYALGQHELKKLLAYHSIENIGIIVLGLGIGLLGRNHQMPFLAVLGFGGALLHVFNHSVFKGLLFLGAGAVIQKTHTGEMDHLGGLAKTMPLVSGLFLIGALAICGLPLLNGFISEFIIFFGLFHGLLGLPLQGAVLCALGILSLALMGALALACFTKVYGTVFLGEPRRPTLPTEMPIKTSPWMIVPMVILAGLCLWVGLNPQPMAGLALGGGKYLIHAAPLSVIDLSEIFIPLSVVVSCTFILILLMAFLAVARWALLRSRPRPISETWNCGFSHVTPRFQYTSSSFARPITDFVKALLLLNRHGGKVSGEFPGKMQISSSVHDASEERMFRPVFLGLTRFSKKLEETRIRYTQIYLMYIFFFLIFLLAWKLK
ncbi:MAG: hydrogenase [Candidatus Omnitrophica bacterium]|nr:hydrogenase [Candidatus Omnitrophota bacterium]